MSRERLCSCDHCPRCRNRQKQARHKARKRALCAVEPREAPTPIVRVPEQPARYEDLWPYTRYGSEFGV